MVPRTSRELLKSVRPVPSVVAGRAMVVSLPKFDNKNGGYSEPFSLVRWLGMLTSVVATVVASAAVSVFVVSQGISLGTNAGDQRPVADSSSVG